MNSGAYRVLLLTSSRATKKRKTDRLSDYDIELYVNDLALFTENDDWLHEFGDVMVLMPEKRTLLGQEQMVRMVIYKNGDKVGPINRAAT